MGMDSKKCISNLDEAKFGIRILTRDFVFNMLACMPGGGSNSLLS